MSAPTYDVISSPEVSAWLRERGVDPTRATTEQIAEALNATGDEPISFTSTADRIELGPPSAPPARTRLTFEDFVAAKAPLYHAPAYVAPYLFVDGRWVQDWPMPAGMAPMRRELDAMTALWCYSVSQKLGG